MEPEVPTVNNKKILIIALVVVFAVAGIAVWYLFMQKDTTEQVVEVVAVAQNVKISAIDAAKLQILRDLMTSAPANTASQTEKLSILKNLQIKAPATKASDAEKLKILQGLAVQ